MRRSKGPSLQHAGPAVPRGTIRKRKYDHTRDMQDSRKPAQSHRLNQAAFMGSKAQDAAHQCAQSSQQGRRGEGKEMAAGPRPHTGYANRPTRRGNTVWACGRVEAARSAEGDAPRARV
ncbi:hypothetical protein BS78_04G280000 [Paspalum vaginatum]|nr:hypothetical protein BS78_04G280000 [Paspalum vaginatum]